MEVKFFTEKYNPEYGSVFRPSDPSIINNTTRSDGYKITEPVDVFNNMADFKDDNNYRAFEDSMKRADKVILYYNDAVYPGQIANIYQIIIE